MLPPRAHTGNPPPIQATAATPAIELPGGTYKIRVVRRKQIGGHRWRVTRDRVIWIASGSPVAVAGRIAIAVNTIRLANARGIL